MPFVTASVESKTLHRVSGWSFLACVSDQVPDELDPATLGNLPPFQYLHVYSWGWSQWRVRGLQDNYPVPAWMFDAAHVGRGFIQVYSHPHGNSADIHIYLGAEEEERWLPELDRVLHAQHLDFEILANQFLGRASREQDTHGGTVLTFRALPEFSVTRKGTAS